MPVSTGQNPEKFDRHGRRWLILPLGLALVVVLIVPPVPRLSGRRPVDLRVVQMRFYSGPIDDDVDPPPNGLTFHGWPTDPGHDHLVWFGVR
jgi:hypothetical protein